MGEDVSISIRKCVPIVSRWNSCILHSLYKCLECTCRKAGTSDSWHSIKIGDLLADNTGADCSGKSCLQLLWDIIARLWSSFSLSNHTISNSDWELYWVISCWSCIRNSLIARNRSNCCINHRSRFCWSHIGSSSRNWHNIWTYWSFNWCRYRYDCVRGISLLRTTRKCCDWSKKCERKNNFFHVKNVKTNNTRIIWSLLNKATETRKKASQELLARYSLNWALYRLQSREFHWPQVWHLMSRRVVWRSQ